MSRVRAELWVAALVRRLNDAGEFCVVSRRGDKDAGQIWIEVDHLDGTCSLFAPAPANPDATDRQFVARIKAKDPIAVRERIVQEAEFDPDFWVVSVETRKPDLGLTIVDLG
ncbi:DUF1491 family protein [Maritalea porphyrae]|uniref:DUF1491 family protein n=1 Tax=Maritalea porphyrae TaxID=880732 RepID=A0ABQ5UUA8_9HYPH|nr:DUF1491 family protein [Maritalea porphyrae]GLQ17930.1 hypothetical protein GCM10007879_21790 [Maritalea porphyrae]